MIAHRLWVGLTLLLVVGIGSVVGSGSEATVYLPLLPTPRIIVVTGQGDQVAADGVCTLREAIHASNFNATVNECYHDGLAEPDTIVFAPSLSGATIVVTEFPLRIEGNLTISGPGTNALTLSGNGSSGVLEAARGEVEPIVITIADLTIANGHWHSGGAIDTWADMMIVHNVLFEGNLAEGSGGAIRHFNLDGQLMVEDSAFNNNTAMGAGGAIQTNGLLFVANSHFFDNVASEGGAIAIVFSSGNEIANAVFSGNSAEIGGGIYAGDGALTITNSTFSSNTVTAPMGGGGGVFASGPLNIVGSTFSANTATYGGGIQLLYGSATLANSTISGNSALAQGGGLSLSANAPSMAELNLFNATIADNTAPQGAGIYTYQTNVHLANNVIAGNSGGDCFLEGSTFTSTGPNLAGDGTCPGFTIPSGNAALGPLQNNGGPTATHAPGLGSQGIDAGDNGLCAASPVNNFDQRGLPRPRDGDGDGTAVCDLGSFEVQQGFESRTVHPYRSGKSPAALSLSWH